MRFIGLGWATAFTLGLTIVPFTLPTISTTQILLFAASAQSSANQAAEANRPIDQGDHVAVRDLQTNKVPSWIPAYAGIHDGLACVASILFQLESLRESCAVAAVAGKQQLHSITLNPGKTQVLPSQIISKKSSHST